MKAVKQIKHAIKALYCAQRSRNAINILSDGLNKNAHTAENLDNLKHVELINSELRMIEMRIEKLIKEI